MALARQQGLFLLQEFLEIMLGDRVERVVGPGGRSGPIAGPCHGGPWGYITLAGKLLTKTMLTLHYLPPERCLMAISLPDARELSDDILEALRLAPCGAVSWGTPRPRWPTSSVSVVRPSAAAGPARTFMTIGLILRPCARPADLVYRPSVS